MYDRDNSNQVTEHELIYILQELGQSRSQDEVKALVSNIDIFRCDIGMLHATLFSI